MNLRQLKNTPWPKEEQDGFITVYDSSKVGAREGIKDFCRKLEAKLLAKFDKGALEHGEDWSGLDLGREMGNEILDLINYSIMQAIKGD